MDNFIYFWAQGVYCGRSELEDFIDKHGENYDVATADIFFKKKWNPCW